MTLWVWPTVPVLVVLTLLLMCLLPQIPRTSPEHKCPDPLVCVGRSPNSTTAELVTCLVVTTECVQALRETKRVPVLILNVFLFIISVVLAFDYLGDPANYDDLDNQDRFCRVTP